MVDGRSQLWTRTSYEDDMMEIWYDDERGERVEVAWWMKTCLSRTKEPKSRKEDDRIRKGRVCDRVSDRPGGRVSGGL